MPGFHHQHHVTNPIISYIQRLKLLKTLCSWHAMWKVSLGVRNCDQSSFCCLHTLMHSREVHDKFLSPPASRQTMSENFWSEAWNQIIKRGAGCSSQLHRHYVCCFSYSVHPLLLFITLAFIYVVKSKPFKFNFLGYYQLFRSRISQASHCSSRQVNSASFTPSMWWWLGNVGIQSETSLTAAVLKKGNEMWGGRQRWDQFHKKLQKHDLCPTLMKYFHTLTQPVAANLCTHQLQRNQHDIISSNGIGCQAAGWKFGVRISHQDFFSWVSTRGNLVLEEKNDHWNQP